MNFRQLEIFLAVTESRSFTAAAQQLGMAQPAVSLAIRKLEELAGGRLLERGKGGVKLTDAGQLLLRHAHSILAHVKDAKREINAFQRLEIGRVTLGAPTMIAGFMLPEILVQFRRKYHGVELGVVQGGAKMIEEAVRVGQIDIGIISDWHAAGGLHIERVASRRMVACAGKNSIAARAKSLTWDQFLRNPLILFPGQYYQRQLIDHICRVRGRRANIVIEAETVPLMIELIASGAGIATLLDAAAAAFASRIAVIALPADAVVPVALCARGGAEHFGAAQRALWSFLKDGLASR